MTRNPESPDEPGVTSMNLQDIPAYREMASSDAFRKAKAAAKADEAKQRHLEEHAQGEWT